MASAKAIQIGKDIDTARCNGNWVAIAELARRYRKYNSEGTSKSVVPLFFKNSKLTFLY